MDRWISVSDRLPDGDCEVLTYRDNRRIAITSETYHDGRWGGDTPYLHPVTHWMPTPDAPTATGGSKKMKPCPFCGSENISVCTMRKLKTDVRCWIRCNKCLIQTREFDCEQDAEKYWNTRYQEETE